MLAKISQGEYVEINRRQGGHVSESKFTCTLETCVQTQVLHRQAISERGSTDGFYALGQFDLGKRDAGFKGALFDGM